MVETMADGESRFVTKFDVNQFRFVDLAGSDLLR